MQLSHTAYLVLASVSGLSACTAPKPVSVEQAMAQCTERARSAVKPDVSVGVGIGIGRRVRTGVGIGIELSSDYLKGTPPEEVYETCVVAKSGEKPTEPLKL
ncbi:MAG: hypothetical protein JKX71_12300 [Amylibacter sp.]|nr:hypothetical protein [Amylibacter sp.]